MSQTPRWCWSVRCRKCAAPPGQTCVTARGKLPTQSHAIRMDDAASPWGRNDVQFPRLISEINSCVALTTEQVRSLCESMDLTVEELDELFDRADVVWQAIKDKT